MKIDTRNLTEEEKSDLSAQYLRILELCADESAEYSLGHYKKICNIIDAKPAPSARVQWIRTRRLVALLVAAAMIILAGCTAVIYKEQLGDFFTEAYEDFIKGSFAEENENNNNIISEYYTLTYVPEGYELVNEFVSDNFIKYVWVNNLDSKIIFEQQSIYSSGYFLDNETGFFNTIEMDNYTVYCRIVDNTYYCIWNNQEYAFTLYFDHKANEEEIIKIISKIEIFAK